MKKVKVYKNVKVNNSERRLVTASEVKKAKRIRKINKAINIFMILVVPIVLVFFGALIQRETCAEAINWMSSHKGMVLLNHVFIVFLYFLFQFIFKKPWVAELLSSIIYMSIPIISKLKFDIRGEVLLINDLALAGNFDEMTAFVEFSDSLFAQLFIIITFILIVTILLCARKNIKRLTSVVYTLLFVAIILVSFFIPFSSQRILAKCGINNGVRFSPNVIHDKQGTWLGIYSNFMMNNVSEPFGYSKERIYAILNNVKNSINIEEKEDSFGDDIIPNEVSKEKPNVIMIMSESFFDPTIIPDVEYSKDPIPNFRKLCETCESGKMITSTFGGGTSTIEFEAFTGETVEFLPYGTVPYTDMPKNLKNVQSIQRVFNENGYHTIAVHDYDGSFYNRIEAYDNLGFDKFLESKDLSNVNYFGKYISDQTLMDNIKDLIEKREDDAPFFIWGLTMQNHTPFQTSNYTEGFDRVKITSSNLSEEANDKLLAYVNGVYESDIQLKRLIDYLEKLDEPTILMFYGDHMPSLYEVYYETGMITTKVTTDWTKEEMLKMHTMPYFIYDNYLDKEVTHDNVTGAVLLGNKLLNYAGIKKTNYFYFLDTLNYLALRDRLFIDGKGDLYNAITQECNSKAQDHKMLEYDMIYGKNYVAQYEKEN